MEALLFLEKNGFKMHLNTLYDRLRKGDIKGKKILNQWHISEKELKKHIGEQ